MMKRLRNLSELSERELVYAQNIERWKILKAIFKDVPGGARQAANFIVHVGYMIKWLLFWIFCTGFVIVVIRNDTLASKLIFCFLLILWWPGLEDVMLKKINYKIIVITKFILAFIVIRVAALLNL